MFVGQANGNHNRGSGGIGVGLVEGLLEEGSWRDARKIGFSQTLDFDEE
jgi:hypothetical protein